MWKNIWWVRPPHAVNIHTHIFAMDSFKRKLKFLDNKVCNYFFLGTLNPKIVPKSKRLKARCRKHSASQCWHTSGLLLYHVDDLGSHKLPQKFEKKIIFAASHCSWNLSMPLCIDPWDWFIKGDKDMVGLDLQKASESPPKRCKWICHHYHELSQHRETSLTSLHLSTIPCLSLPTPHLENPFEPNLKQGKTSQSSFPSCKFRGDWWLVEGRAFGRCHLANTPLLTDQPTGMCRA